MPTDLLSIAAGGARAARVALDVTGQNIANANTEGYVRRTVGQVELAPSSAFGHISNPSFSGVRISGVQRHADQFRMAEVRRTTSDATRADAQLAGLKDIETAIENAGTHGAAVNFEASLDALAVDPTNIALRTSVLEGAGVLANSYNIAADTLTAVGDGLHFHADADVLAVNNAAEELARINLRLARTQAGTSDQTALLDQRDVMLQNIAEHADITVSFGSNQTVEVTLGSGSGVPLVQGNTAQTLASAVAGDGTLSFTLGGSPVTLSGGDLAGKALALIELRDTRAALDTAASNLITLVNGTQAAGAALDGTGGQPIFSGTGAGDIGVALADPAGIATAPAGSPAGSRDAGNLAILRASLSASGPAQDANSLLFNVSSRVSGLGITNDVLATIANSARLTLADQAGVDLDQEAVNLLRFQQAFQASGRVIQAAADVIDTLLAIR